MNASNPRPDFSFTSAVLPSTTLVYRRRNGRRQCGYVAPSGKVCGWHTVD